MTRRVDKAPFNNQKVREALQKAIDLQSIATNYYGGTCSADPQSLTSSDLKGWGFPYDQWPQSLKDQYSYDPTAAKALLAAAGFPNGFTTDCVADSSGDLNLLEIVQSDFAAIGVKMSIQAWIPHDPDQLCKNSAPARCFSLSFIRVTWHVLPAVQTVYSVSNGIRRQL